MGIRAWPGTLLAHLASSRRESPCWNLLVKWSGAQAKSHGESAERPIAMTALPRIELIPARDAVCLDEAVTLDILVRITPALPEALSSRPRLNLALVLDRSGSMSEGKKMAHAREAAIHVVGQLLPTDRVSIVAFDNFVETIAPEMLATDKP